MTLFTLENTEPAMSRKWFSLADVGIHTTRKFWLNLPFMLAVGIGAAYLFQSSDQLLLGVVSGFLIIASSFIHGLGHILSSRAVGAPMTALVLTATVSTIRFNDDSEPASRVHVGRSLGGPVLNLATGILLLIAGLLLDNNYLLIFAGSVNLIFGAFTLMPIPSLDGAVLFRELRNWKSASPTR